ncbi:MAG TPA: hypothetical protein VLJ42_10255 [Solirubrobacteraceae bacterium]|nr:hypothetical protein [Solirubrobacteraceae bacterium]
MNAISLKRTAAAALTAALVLGAAGCATTGSAGKFKGEAHGVAQTIADLQTDATASDEQKVCERDLASTVVARLNSAGSSCARAIDSQLSQIDSFNLTVESVKVSGASATASVKGTRAGKNRIEQLQLVKEGKRWKISSLG